MAKFVAIALRGDGWPAGHYDRDGILLGLDHRRCRAAARRITTEGDAYDWERIITEGDAYEDGKIVL